MVMVREKNLVVSNDNVTGLRPPFIVGVELSTIRIMKGVKNLMTREQKNINKWKLSRKTEVVVVKRKSRKKEQTFNNEDSNLREVKSDEKQNVDKRCEEIVLTEVYKLIDEYEKYEDKTKARKELRFFYQRLLEKKVPDKVVEIIKRIIPELLRKFFSW